MRLYFHKNYDKQYGKMRIKEKKKAQERLVLFIRNPFNPILNNHPLKGKYLNYRSINITGDLRAIYKLIDYDDCIFTTIDNHSNLYF